MVWKAIVVLLLVQACASWSVLKQLEELDDNIVEDFSDGPVINPSDKGKALGDKLRQIVHELGEIKDEIASKNDGAKEPDENEVDAEFGMTTDIKPLPEYLQNAKRSFVQNYRWLPVNGTLQIPYTFDRTSGFKLSEAEISGIEKIIDYVNGLLSCHDKAWIPYDPTKQLDSSLSVAKFTKNIGCFSYIGNVGRYINTKPFQEISIGNGCLYKGIVAHEMMHAMGFNHEQSRADRDLYVKINFENIRDGRENNFEKAKNFDPGYNRSTYDLQSVMHYSAYSFTKNGKATIVPRDPNTPLSALGQRRGLSKEDISELNILFDCKAETTVAPETTTEAPETTTEARRNNTVAPETTTEAPETTTEAPETTTEAPETTTEAPETTTVAPETTTEAPETTTEAPETTTEAPETTTEAPETTTEAPETTTEAPETTTEAPETTTEAPETTTEAPETTTEARRNTTVAPETTTEAPETTTEAPETTTEAPETTTEAPETTTEAPETTTEAPETTTEAPETTTEAPETTTVAPKTTKKPATVLFDCPFNSSSTRCNPNRNTYFYRWAVSSDCKDSLRFCRTLKRFGFCKNSSAFFKTASEKCRSSCNTCPPGSKSFLTTTRYAHFYLRFYQTQLGSRCISQEENFCVSLDYMFSVAPNNNNRLTFYMLSYTGRKRIDYDYKPIRNGSPGVWNSTKLSMNLKCGSFYYFYGLTADKQRRARVSLDNIKITTGSC